MKIEFNIKYSKINISIIIYHISYISYNRIYASSGL